MAPTSEPPSPPSAGDSGGRRPRPGPGAPTAPTPPAPAPPPSPSPPPLSRRSLLGLSAIAGAGAGALIAGGIAGFGDSESAPVVEAHGIPVVTTDPQHLSLLEQQQAVMNLGAVRTVEPEQFPGGSDDAQFAAAVRTLAETGGEIRLRPGKVYTWTAAIPAVDWSVHGGLVITAWGAAVEYTGAGTAFTSRQSQTVAGTQTLTVLGGVWSAPRADSFFRIVDSGNHLFFRCRGEVPDGTFVALSNVQFFSERNHFVELEDYGCREVLRFSIDGSPSASFARTVVKDLRLQGGTAGYAKLNVITAKGAVQPAVYDSTFDGVSGNIDDGVVVQRLAGGMSGTKLLRFQLESPDGATTSAYWDVGSLSGKPPTLVDGPPVLRNMLLFTAASPPGSPFAPTVAASGLTVGAAAATVPYLVELSAPGAVSVPAAECNVAVVTLNAPCLSSVIDVIDNANPGAVQTLPTTTQVMTLAFVQGGAGGFAYAWPSTCRFAHGRPPTDTSAGTMTSVTFVFQAGVWLEIARAEAVPTR